MDDLAYRIRANQRTSRRMADPWGLHSVSYYSAGSNLALEANLRASQRMTDPLGLDIEDNLPSEVVGSDLVLVPQRPSANEVPFGLILSYLRAKMGDKRYAQFVDYVVDNESKAATAINFVRELDEVSAHMDAAITTLSEFEQRSNEFWADYHQRVEQRKKP